jgi:DNA-binding CsgD family transcriptional regulator
MRALADQAERHRDAASLHRITANRALLAVAAVVARGSGLPHQGALDRWQQAEAARLDRTATPLLWADLAAAWTTLGRPVSAAYARWREAETRLDSGAGSAAIDALRAAHLASLDLRARGLQHELERLARWHRIDLLAAPSAPAEETDTALAAYGLTERELEVLGQLAAGRTNREIAGDLFISSKTASVHVSNILRKLDVSGRQEAARVAHRLGVRSR